ncbi:DUF1772 domain-containing protein [Streptosporangium longisporum]|uniref:DUF1772 domain-containing protein n=1 Tax=Streptosporangium longisporum TaxID=46187 RepID=A0ABP6L6R5_9ACTN
MNLSPIARISGLLSAGLFAGFLVAVLVLELSLRRFGASVYTQVRMVELDALDRLAAATLVPALIAMTTVVVLALRGGTRVPRPHLTALILLTAVLVTTITVNMPINADQLTWDVETPPADWTTARDRWQIAHAVRTVAAVLAFGCLAVAAHLGTGVPPDPRPRPRGRILPVPAPDRP